MSVFLAGRARPPAGGDDDSGRVPPGQYLTDGFPVLSAGPTPHTSLLNFWKSAKWVRGLQLRDVV